MKKTWHYYLAAVIQSALLAVASPVARAQDATGGYVSRKEYEELKAEMLAMKKELASLKKAKRAESNQESAKDQAAADMHKEVAAPAVEPLAPALGTTKFHIAGFGVGMFEARNGSVSNFSATFNPIFLWELSPKLLFESRLEIEPSGSGTNLELEYAQLTYLLNDYITLGAGEFLTPSNVFVERFEALWINKLPDRPLAVYDGILPERSFGFQVRGGVPIGPTRANYAFMFPTARTLTPSIPAGLARSNSTTSVITMTTRPSAVALVFSPSPEWKPVTALKPRSLALRALLSLMSVRFCNRLI